uniref:Knottin scorpion toxin-like domain-containing protein n=1 Tax=Oryza meridionalis TaxID=40149 RepID=A0A0E0F349_9ORYZ
MELQLATRSSKSLAVAVAVPLLMCLFLVAAAAVAASSETAVASSPQYQPNYGNTYSTCFEVGGCDDTGCAIRCRNLGHNPAGSACWTSNVGTIFCCCGLGRPPPVA